MQRNQYKQNLALANCTYINIFFYCNIQLCFHIKPSMILFITSSFSLYPLKKCFLDLQLVLLKQRLEHHAPKENKVKRKVPYKLLKIVCYKVLKSLQHWLVGRLFDAIMALRQSPLLSGWRSTVGQLLSLPKSLGMHRNEPRAQNSCVQRTLEVLNLFSAEAQSFKQNFFPTCCLSALLLSLFPIHLRSHDLHTRDAEES